MYFFVSDPPGQYLNLNNVSSLAELKTAISGMVNAAAVLILGDVTYLAVKGNSGISFNKDGKEIPVIKSTGETVGASGKTDKSNEYLLRAGSVSKNYLPTQARSFKPNIYLKIDKEKLEFIKVNRKAILIAIFILFLIYAVFRQVSYRLENDRGLRTDREITKTEEKIKAAIELAQLNKPLAKANLETEKGNLLKFDGDRKKIEAEVAVIDQKIREILEINNITPDVFYDFSLAKDGAGSWSGFYTGMRFNFLDKNSGTLLFLDVKNKSAKIVAADEKFKDGSYFAALGERLYIYTGSGIYNDKKTLAIKPDKKWQAIAAIGTFAGNIYLLDTKANQIWKHIATDNGFSEARSYLDAGVEALFSGATALDINGSVFVAAGDKVLKYSSGKQEDFNITGLDKPLGKVTLMAATDKLKNIYFWDEPNRRVVVVSDSGQYLSQYVIGGASNFSGLFADETLQKIFLLSGAKVYSVGLK